MPLHGYCEPTNRLRNRAVFNSGEPTRRLDTPWKHRPFWRSRVSMLFGRFQYHGRARGCIIERGGRGRGDGLCSALRNSHLASSQVHTRPIATRCSTPSEWIAGCSSCCLVHACPSTQTHSRCSMGTHRLWKWHALGSHRSEDPPRLALASAQCFQRPAVVGNCLAG